MSKISYKLVFVPQKTTSVVAKFTDFPNFKLKYLENQGKLFQLERFESCVRVFENLSYEINLHQWPCPPLKRCYLAFHLIFYTMILFMRLKDLHGQVMVKNEIANILSAPKNDK